MMPLILQVVTKYYYCLEKVITDNLAVFRVRKTTTDLKGNGVSYDLRICMHTGMVWEMAQHGMNAVKQRLKNLLLLCRF